jgi:hypothetical protein
MHVDQHGPSCRSLLHVLLTVGLDPAEPAFKDTAAVVHLDREDAQFVDVIHTDGSEFNYVSGKVPERVLMLMFADNNFC